MKLVNYFQFHSDLYKKGLEYAIEHTVELGFDAVEFLGCVPHDERLLPDAEAAVKVAERLHSYGLETACYSLGADLYAPDIKAAKREFYLHAEIAAALEAPFLHHTLYMPLNRPAGAPTYDEMLARLLEPATHIADYCAMQGLGCLYEPQGVYFNGLHGFSRLVEEMKDRCNNVGVCGDVGNPLFADEHPNGIFACHASQMKHIHIKDYYYRNAPEGGGEWLKTDGGKWIAPARLGEGDVDIAYCLRELHRVGYTGAFALKFEGDDDTLRRAIRYFKELHRAIFE